MDTALKYSLILFLSKIIVFINSNRPPKDNKTLFLLSTEVEIRNQYDAVECKPGLVAENFFSKYSLGMSEDSAIDVMSDLLTDFEHDQKVVQK